MGSLQEESLHIQWRSFPEHYKQPDLRPRSVVFFWYAADYSSTRAKVSMGQCPVYISKLLRHKKMRITAEQSQCFMRGFEQRKCLSDRRWANLLTWHVFSCEPGFLCEVRTSGCCSLQARCSSVIFRVAVITVIVIVSSNEGFR